MSIKHRLTRCVLPAGVVVAAASFPVAAQARIAFEPPAGSGPAPILSAPSATQTSSDSGFQWDDAAIGAAGAAVLLGAGATGTVSLRRRRVRRIAVG